jgi:hypothetical protein
LTEVLRSKFTTRTGAFYKYVVNNWQLTSLTTLASGRPYSVSVNVTDTAVAGMANRGSLNGAGLSYRVPFWPYYSQYYPARYNSDACIAKIVPLNEKGMIISPTPLYGQPSADAGFPDGTQARRIQLSARFTF